MGMNMVARTAWSRRAAVSGIGAFLLLRSAAGITAGQTPAASPVSNEDRSSWLVDSDDLAADGEQADLRIVALTPNEAYIAGHIPNAVAIDWPAMEIGTTTDAAIADWTSAMRQLVASLGIGASADVVIYDEGTLFAARLHWLLHFLGHDAQRILDGGLPAWQQRGLPVARGTPAAPALEADIRPGTTVRAEALAPLEDVRAAVGADDVVFVDARSPDEYQAGHIPGAVNVEYRLNAEPEAPRFWKSNEALLELYDMAGVTSDKRVVPYCSTGVRSAVTWYTLRMIGFPDVALFTGSWAEWSVHPELPVTTGPRP